MNEEIKEKLNALVNNHCANIKNPYTIQEICEFIDTGDYGAEFILKHLLLWCNSIETKESVIWNAGNDDKIKSDLYLPAYEASQIWLRLTELMSQRENRWDNGICADFLSQSERELYEALTKRFTREPENQKI